MKDSTAKTLLNYSTSLTKVTSKKLGTAKSPEDRIEIISKQFEDIKKKVAEVVEKGEPIKSEGESVVKLEFDKLNKRLDIIEATEYTNNNFIMGLMKGATNDEGSNDSDLLSDQLSDLFGFDGDGKLELDEVIGLFSGTTVSSSGLSLASKIIKGVGSAGKALVTNPYIMIPLATLAAVYGITELVKDQQTKVEKRLDELTLTYSGTNSNLWNDTFKSISGGKSLDELMNEESKATGDDKVNLQNQINEYLENTKSEISNKIMTNVVNPNNLATEAANLGVDTQSSGKSKRDYWRQTNTTWDNIRIALFGSDKVPDYSDILSTIDMSALGSINGDNVSANVAAQNIANNFNSILNTDLSGSISESNNLSFKSEPSITSFDYSNPIKSIEKISLEYCKITRGAYKSMLVDENRLSNVYNTLVTSFINPIGKKEGFLRTTLISSWDALRDTIKSISRYEGSIGSYANKLLISMPDYTQLCKIYYSEVYSDNNSQYASLMTISQQYELLGAELDPHSKLSEIKTKFYFLPVCIRSGSGGVIDKNTRISLNSVGVQLAFKIQSTGNDGSIDQFLMDSLAVTSYNVEGQNTKLAYDITSSNVMLSDGSYDNDAVIYGILQNYSGLNDEDMISFAKELEGYSYTDLLDAYNTQYDNEIWDKLTQKVDPSNLNNILKLVTSYQYKNSINTDDVIESYNKMKKKDSPELTNNSFNKILKRISEDKDLRSKYITALNTNDSKLYLSISKDLGLEFNNNKNVKSFIDRIFNNYMNFNLVNEDGIDLDAVVYSTGISGFTAEDLSSTINMFGLGTLDELKNMGLSDKQIKDFIKLANQHEDLSSELIVNKDGSIDQVYNKSGNSNDSEDVKSALIEVLTKIGLTPENISNLLDSQSLIAKGQSALLYSGVRSSEGIIVDASNDVSLVE